MTQKVYKSATDENFDRILSADDPEGVGYGIGEAAGVIGVPRDTMTTNRSAGMDVGGMASVDFAAEEQYWRTNFAERPYVNAGDTFETFEDAYRVGYENYGRFVGHHFDEIEDDLRLDYERRIGGKAPAWERAWNRPTRKQKT